MMRSRSASAVATNQSRPVALGGILADGRGQLGKDGGLELLDLFVGCRPVGDKG